MHRYIDRAPNRVLDSDDDGVKNPFKWVLILEMLIFLGHSYICFKNSTKYKQNYEQRRNDGTLFKFRLTKEMCLGSLVRGISIILMVAVHSSSESGGLLAWEYLFITLPCFFWMPSYFSVIIFFMKILHLITGKNTNFVQPVLNGLFWCSAGIYSWFCIRALTRNDYDDFVYETSWLMGILYIVMAIGIFLFGQNITWNMAHTENQEGLKTAMQSLKSVQILTYLCAIVFLARGIFSIISVADTEITLKHLAEVLHIWHGLSFLISELVPAVATTYLIKEKPQRQQSHEDFELGVLLRNTQNPRERPLLTDV